MDKGLFFLSLLSDKQRQELDVVRVALEDDPGCLDKWVTPIRVQIDTALLAAAELSL